MRFRGKTTGPFSLAQIEQMRQLGRVTAFHEVSADGVKWILAVDAGLVTSPNLGQNPAPLGVIPQPEPAASTGPPWYHLDASGARQGPIPREEMAEMVAGGKFTASSEVWCEGFADWVPLEQTDLAGFLPHKQPAVAKGTLQVVAGQANGNGLVVAGYLCCVGSLFLCPPVFALAAIISPMTPASLTISFFFSTVFGIAALTCAIVNLSRRQVPHGLAQLFLSIVLSSAGSLLGYLVWQEIGKQ
jgi:GYF domain 2